MISVQVSTGKVCGPTKFTFAAADVTSLVEGELRVISLFDLVFLTTNFSSLLESFLCYPLSRQASFMPAVLVLAFVDHQQFGNGH